VEALRETVPVDVVAGADGAAVGAAKATLRVTAAAKRLS